MIPAPIHPKEQSRLSALSKYNVLDSEADKSFDELTQIASAICGTPISLISLVDDHRQWFKSKVGIDAQETEKDIAFCSHAILQEQVFEVSNALLDERFQDNPLVTGAPNIRFYAGAPLVSPDGMPIGTLCVIDQEPRVLSDIQRETLQVLANQVIGQLELRLKNQQLKQLNAMREKFFAMIAHDLRSPFNCILNFSRQLSKRSENIDSQKAHDLGSEILGAATNTYQLLDELLQWSQTCLREQSCSISNNKLSLLIEEACLLHRETACAKDIQLLIDVPEKLYIDTDPTLFKAVIRNLVSNAIKYSSGGDEVAIQAKTQEDCCEISVCDQGNGITPDKVQQLFKNPLESEEGTDGEHGCGLGLSLCKTFMDLLSGEICYDQNFKAGARFVLSLPLRAST